MRNSDVTTKFFIFQKVEIYNWKSTLTFTFSWRQNNNFWKAFVEQTPFESAIVYVDVRPLFARRECSAKDK